jgi:DNA-binding transcriptional regulator WhiA
MANSMTTKTGKTRLGPLSLTQLKEMLEKSSKPKDRDKIENRIRTLEKILHVGQVRVVETYK